MASGGRIAAGSTGKDTVQTTLKGPITFRGMGLHTGQPARVTVHPASAEYGIWFRRLDVTDHDPLVPAKWDAAERTALCTRLVNAAGTSVSTVEHLMAALAGCGVHNALVELDGPEIPILDGSAAPFVREILARGVRRLAEPVRALQVLKRVDVREGAAMARLEPARGLRIDFTIEFDEAVIGRQRLSLDMANGAFLRELCDSRTFCRLRDVEAMRANGRALGGTLANAVVVDGGRVLTPGGLRHPDEPVRHKMLDALGDLALAGAPLLACYTGHRAGHALTNRLLRALFADPEATRFVTCDAALADRLPGAGLGRSDIAGLAA